MQKLANAHAHTDRDHHFDQCDSDEQINDLINGQEILLHMNWFANLTALVVPCEFSGSARRSCSVRCNRVMPGYSAAALER